MFPSSEVENDAHRGSQTGTENGMREIAYGLLGTFDAVESAVGAFA